MLRVIRQNYNYCPYLLAINLTSKLINIFYTLLQFLSNMSLRTSKDMLDFLLNTHKPKTQVLKNSSNQIMTARDVNISKRSYTKNRTFYQHYESRARPMDVVEPSIQAQLSSPPQNNSETSSKKIHNSQQKLSHRLFHCNRLALVQFDNNHSSQNKIAKRKVELTPNHLNRITRYEQYKKQDMVGKNRSVRHSNDMIKNRTVKVLSPQAKMRKDMNTQLKKSEYYIQQIKFSTQKFINNHSYTNPHINHITDSISAFHTFAHIPIPEHCHKSIHLPPLEDNRITLLFDLDETLIHTQIMNWDTKQQDMGWGQTIQICTDNGDYLTNLKIRPHALEVLNKLKQHFELGVFTASQQHYGSKVLQVLDPNNELFKVKLFRHHCYQMHSRSTSYIKDLRILKNRDLAKVILIDNSPYTYIFQKSNAIPITSFFSDQDDQELLKLQSFLLSLRQVKDVRQVLKDYFKLDQYHHFNSMPRLVRQLYAK